MPTFDEIAHECAAEMLTRSGRQVTGPQLIAHFDRRFPGEVWPLMNLYVDLFPTRLPALSDQAPVVKGDLRWDAEKGIVRTWTGEAWWP